MGEDSARPQNEFVWDPQPEAAGLTLRLLDQFRKNSQPARELGERMLCETGTRLFDWVDHFLVLKDDKLDAELERAGFQAKSMQGGGTIWEHLGALLPRVVTRAGSTNGLAIKVESVVDYLAASNLSDSPIEGGPLASRRMARLTESGGYELWVVERHGDRAIECPGPVSPGEAQAILQQAEIFQLRPRHFVRDEDGFRQTLKLVEEAKQNLGVHRVCALFFEAERDYWMRRNLAGRVQKARQDRLGLGWANQDHHTYRSSRQNFAALIQILEALGFTCRERFYAGAEAGWGAQVLEQRECGLAVFADVDLLAEEVAGDFAHEGLAPREELGTIGLWCALHGEAMLQAGLHHLEAQFDFDAARDQLSEKGIGTMAPFTDFTFLRQAFTTGEMWSVEPSRLEAAVADGRITTAQADQFAERGALGSHLEILERNDGYNGFNQTGISKIIAKTDPRSS